MPPRWARSVSTLATVAGPTESQLADPQWRRRHCRIDAENFRGLREEMEFELSHREEPSLIPILGYWATQIVTATILVSALQMGLAVQYTDGLSKALLDLVEHICTAVFIVEMVVKIAFLKLDYFHNAWNLFDCGLVCMSIVGYLIPVIVVGFNTSQLTVLRMMRCLRIVRVLRTFEALRTLMHSMVRSLRSIVWIIALMALITYIAAVLCCQVIDKHAYDGYKFDPSKYFGDLPGAILTFWNVCIMAEWSEIVRPMWMEQPQIVLFVLFPYIGFCTFGMLNLVIGVIAEKSMQTATEARERAESLQLREKMKQLVHMTESIFCTNSGKLTKKEFENWALRSPKFVELMRSCNLPRGFEIADLFEIFNASNDSSLEKDEFINGMFRLAFNDLSMHSVCIVQMMAQMRYDIKVHVEQELDKLCTHFLGQTKNGREEPGAEKSDGQGRDAPANVEQAEEVQLEVQVSEEPKWRPMMSHGCQGKRIVNDGAEQLGRMSLELAGFREELSSFQERLAHILPPAPPADAADVRRVMLEFRDMMQELISRPPEAARLTGPPREPLPPRENLMERASAGSSGAQEPRARKDDFGRRLALETASGPLQL